jgi:hypothetical protein
MQTEPPEAEPPKPKRRRLQFSLRTLMIGESAVGMELRRFRACAPFIAGHPAIRIIFLVARGVFWDGEIGALFGHSLALRGDAGHVVPKRVLSPLQDKRSNPDCEVHTRKIKMSRRNQ